MWHQWKKRHTDHKECPEINSYKYINQLTVKGAKQFNIVRIVFCFVLFCFVLTNGVRAIGCLYVW